VSDRSDDPLFDEVVALLARFPAAITFRPVLWPWTARTVARTHVGDELVACLGSRSPTCLIPHLRAMSAAGRSRTAWLLRKQRKRDGQARAALFSLLADPSRYVRRQAA